MWRQFGGRLYGLLLLSVFITEVIAIVTLTLTFALRPFQFSLTFPELTALQYALIPTLANLALIALFTMAYYAVSRWWDGRYQRQYHYWAQQWTQGVLDGQSDPPAGIMNKAAVDALLDTRQVLKGESARLVQGWACAQGLHHLWLRQLKRGRPYRQLDALNKIALMALPETFDPVLRFMGARQKHIRMMAALAGLRILADSPDPERIQRFTTTLKTADLSYGMFEHLFTLAEDIAEPLLGTLFTEKSLVTPLLRAAISTAGKLRLVQFLDVLPEWLTHPEPEIRAVVFRAWGQSFHMPREAEAAVLQGAADPNETVRIQATRALALIAFDKAQVVLWERLADPSWWVRYAAGKVLVEAGQAGIALLEKAARGHTDPLGAQMAAECLSERQLMMTDVWADEWVWAIV